MAPTLQYPLRPVRAALSLQQALPISAPFLSRIRAASRSTSNPKEHCSVKSRLHIPKQVHIFPDPVFLDLPHSLSLPSTILLPRAVQLTVVLTLLHGIWKDGILTRGEVQALAVVADKVSVPVLAEASEYPLLLRSPSFTYLLWYSTSR